MKYVRDFLRKRPRQGTTPETLAAPDRLRRRIDVSQLTARSRLLPMMCAMGGTVALTYFFSFQRDQLRWTLVLGEIAVLLAYLALARASREWLAEPDKNAGYVAAMHRLVALQALLGTSWSVLMVSAIHVADTDQRRMVYALAIALMSTAMVSGPAQYAFAFWTPITIGAFLTLVSDPGNIYPPIMIALICYSFLTANAIVSTNRKLFEREKNQVEIERHSSTIQLLLKDFQDGSGSFLWETNAELGITEFNGNLQFAGDDRLDPRGMDFVAFVRAVAAPGEERRAEPDPAVALIAARLAEPTAFKDVILRQDTPGGVSWWSVSGKPVFDHAGQLTGFRGLWADVTDREEYKNALQVAANRDYLTKIYNRAAFNQILAANCEDAARTGASLLCIDLDYFKRVNDSFGHAIGDELLIAVARRLTSCVRPTDFVFRLGGDEFAVILASGGRAQAGAVARRILDQLCKPFVIQDIRLQIGASIGAALIQPGGANPDLLHREADAALYRSKSSGRCTFTFHDDSGATPFSIARTIDLDVRGPIPLDQFFLMYQPIVELESHKIISAEALLRWRHPVAGLVPPGDFIPRIEQNGQISGVGMFAIEQAMRFASRLSGGIILSINISPLQLADIDLPEKIAAGLRAASLEPGHIEFEITESSLLEKDVQKLEVLNRINKIGCGIALDDFGTGYASLLLLEQFPFSKIKIDGSFVREHGYDSRRHLILTSIIRLARELGILVTAEGIETAGQARNMRQLGCSLGQGFYFSRGLTETEFLSTTTSPNLRVVRGSVAS